MSTASIVSKVWSFCNPLQEKNILPAKAPKGRDSITMGAAHRETSRRPAKALKGRHNPTLKNDIWVSPS